MSDRSMKFRDGSETFTAMGSSGNTYHISRNSTAAKARGVEWSCECRAWIIQKKHPCKHMIGPRFKAGVVNVRPAVIAKRITPAEQVARGLTAEERTVANRIIREAAEAKKAAKVGKLRYGFQLAQIYNPRDFVPGRMVAEIKYDGELGMMIDGRIINRSGNDVTERFPEIQTTDDAVLVGELVVLDKNGLSNFSRVQQRGTDDKEKISARSQTLPAKFIAFDILELRGVALADRPFSERRNKLETFFDEAEMRNVDLIKQTPLSDKEHITALLEAAAEIGGEGYMIKNTDQPYKAGRGRNWVKAKTWTDEEFDLLKFEDTGIGEGFIICVRSGQHEQRVVCNSPEMRKKIKAGHKRVEIKYLSKGAAGALRFPSIRRILD